MKPTRHDPWERLAAAARRAPAPEIGAPSFGFVTRTAALGLAAAERPPLGVLVETLSWRALAASALLVALTCAATLPGVVRDAGATTRGDDLLAADYIDPVAEVLDLSS